MHVDDKFILVFWKGDDGKDGLQFFFCVVQFIK